jgi:nitrite reductase/ring-hydroxylating ferredoxin subunit
MAEASGELEGPDFEKGCSINDIANGTMVLGHAFEEPVLVARRGEELFAIGAMCTHYGGPLGERSDGRLYRALPLTSCGLRFADGRSDCSERGCAGGGIRFFKVQGCLA